MEKYLNKEVIVRTQVQGTALRDKKEGILTNTFGTFIELDNNILINIKFIYSIILK